LCQTHAKLVDNDPTRFSVEVLRRWKDGAEEQARIAIERPRIRLEPQSPLAKAERHVPALLKEMRADLASRPTFREFVVLKRGWVYNSSGPFNAYYYDEHTDLDEHLRFLENLGLIDDAAFNSTKRFRLSEDLADYLLATADVQQA
jgi:hypothetical protein